MSDNDFILRLTTVALLTGFLVYMQWERARKRAELRRQSRLVGDVIDVTPLRPRLESLRRDYAAAAQDHARSIGAREKLVAATRRTLSSLSFFRKHHAPDEREHHAA
ncbi:MAG: hypothetical protein RLY20_2697 [Verrucomicrobiota bacterium]|jgi:hypothetical protein